MHVYIHTHAHIYRETHRYRFLVSYVGGLFAVSAIVARRFVVVLFRRGKGNTALIRESVCALCVVMEFVIIVIKQLFDFPDITLSTNAEFEVLLGDRVPVLVDHHHGKESANCAKEETINIVLNALADLVAQEDHDNLAEHKEHNRKANVAQRPVLIECVDNQDDLENDVDEQKKAVEYKVNDE